MDYLNTVLIILYDSETRFLLQHRTNDTQRLPGYWAFFGGQVDKGETTLEAVRREAFEELNYTLIAPEFVFEQDFKLSVAKGHMWVYIERFEGSISILKLQEGQGWGWYNAEETKALKMIEHDRIVIEKIAQYLENQKVIIRGN